VTILLSGCATKVFEPELIVYCPPIKKYDDTFNNKLADEIEALPRSSTHIPEAIGDYAYLRDRIRRCEENKTNE
jgi:hypothetical protein